MRKLNDDERDKVRRKFAALNNINRIKIIELCQEKEYNIIQLSKKLGLGYGTTSQYVTRLKNEGLVKATVTKNMTLIKSLVEINEKGEIKVKG